MAAFFQRIEHDQPQRPGFDHILQKAPIEARFGKDFGKGGADIVIAQCVVDRERQVGKGFAQAEVAVLVAPVDQVPGRDQHVGTRP